MTADAGPDLFGHRAAPAPAGDVDLDYALVASPSDDAAVLRRADWVARHIGPPPPGLGAYDLTAYRELVSAFVSGRHMSCVLLAASVVERHLTLLHRVLGRRWRGSLEEKVERLREIDTPIGFLRPKLRALVAARRMLCAEIAAPVPVRTPEDGTGAWARRLEREAEAALPVAIFVMTRLPAHLCRVAKGQP
jgi:hypothetical protein